MRTRRPKSWTATRTRARWTALWATGRTGLTAARTPVPTFAPVDCVMGNWSAFSSCTSICGGGHMSRHRTIEPEQYGGRPCDENTTSEIVDCNTHACPVDCAMGDWQDWAACSAECGSGSKTRSRTVEIEG